MTRPAIYLLLVTTAAFAADDNWTKVRDLKSGTEVRVIQSGGKAPVIAKFDELTADNLIVVVKTEQIAIARDKIDRIDFRPQKSRVTKETKATGPLDNTNEPPKPPDYRGGSSGPASSYNSSLGIGSKPDFETIYRRQPTPAPAAKP